MPRFLAPKPNYNHSAASSVGALNSDSVPELSGRHTPKSRSTISLTSPPPAHPLSSRTTPNTSTIHIPETPHSDAADKDVQVRPSTDGEGEDERQEIQAEQEEDHFHVSTEDSKEEELSEEQLRKLFEDEEIDRFLRHFTAHVQEVRLPTVNAPVAKLLATKTPNAVTISENAQGIVLSPTSEDFPHVASNSGSEGDEREVTEDSAWTMVDRSYLRAAKDEGTGESLPQPSSLDPGCLSEKIAKKYILPNLPPLQPNTDHRFTIGRARLQAERLNLVTQPAYGPFFARMWGYASWKDRGTSACYCSVFWMLWFLNLLLPALFAIILYALFRRRLFSYPTLKELRDRRHEAARAEALGQEVEKRFATGPEFGVRDAWSLFRSITKGKKKGQTKKGKSAKPGATTKAEENVPQAPLDATEGDEKRAKTGAEGESQAEKDVKRAILQAMSEMADLHERIKNIFLWRRPQASRIYAMALAVLFLVTLLLPVKYLAKLTYFVGGFFFWFVPPIILAVPPADRARIPPAFADSPTDAEYAMEMIAIRVAQGLPVTSKPARKKKGTKAVTADPDTNSQVNGKDAEPKDKEVDWRKWGERAARGFAWAEEGKRVLQGDMPLRQGTWPPAAPLFPPVALAHGQPNAEVETSTYPAQHTTSPGLITLTSSTLSFTQVLSSKPKIQIRLDHIRGVKKTGKMGGLTLKWGETEEHEQEEKFRWVGGRDEVFAKLVGWRGRRWIQL